MTRPADLTTLSPSEKDALIAVLLERDRVMQEQLVALTVRVAALEAENKALRDKLDVPPKTPRNSSKPPSSAPKANGTGQCKAKSKVHAGAHPPAGSRYRHSHHSGAARAQQPLDHGTLHPGGQHDHRPNRQSLGSA